MKKWLFLIWCFLPLLAVAQIGYITTTAGSSTSGFSGDGGPATAARLNSVFWVHQDIYGNIYIADYGNSRIRKVDPAGNISTFAGGGTSTADGINATTARINIFSGGHIYTDVAGNVYFADDSRIRKVNVSTRIITTIVGSPSVGFSGDGGPATAATFNYIHGICTDAAGNMYIADENNRRIRKVNTAGIVTTIAGTGGTGYSGDGGPATAAQFACPEGLCIDASGNLYVCDRTNYVVRKISASGIITTFAGNGSSGHGGDGGQATAASIGGAPSVAIDASGNIYVADVNRVRKISTAGIISTYAGGGSSSASGIPATSAAFTQIWGMSIDRFNNLHISDRWNRTCMVTGLGTPVATSDSMSVFTSADCSSVYFNISPAHYSSVLSVRTSFGDGTFQTDTFSAFTGVSELHHSYSSSGIYTVKHRLFVGSVLLDSVSYNYEYKFCNTAKGNIYYDNNANCRKDSAENLLGIPMRVAVDSNGIAVDTISVSSGFFYRAYGSPGDIYRFSLIDYPASLRPSCSTGGTFYDTLGRTGNNFDAGFECTASSGFDLSVHAVIPVTGVRDQWANVYLQNNGCALTTGTVTFNYSPKYAGGASPILPAPVSATGNTIVWSIPGLSSTLSTPAHLYYAIWSGSTPLTIRDTVQSRFVVTPTTGDADTSNNAVVIIDTVKAGYDPNAIYVKPGGCIASGTAATQLQYTITFENTGNDTAHNIYVMDTLPDYVDPSSMRLVMASHEMYTSKLKDAAGHTVLKFDFPKIKLLDSSYKGLCDGAFIYTINTRPGLATGTDIMNRVGIYFDTNPVVMTNEAHNVIGCPIAGVSSVQSAVTSPLVYPNPASDILNIRADNSAFESYSITNNLGSIVASGNITRAQTEVNIKSLPRVCTL